MDWPGGGAQSKRTTRGSHLGKIQTAIAQQPVILSTSYFVLDGVFGDGGSNGATSDSTKSGRQPPSWKILNSHISTVLLHFKRFQIHSRIWLTIIWVFAGVCMMPVCKGKYKKVKTSICIARLRVYKTPLTRISSLKLSRRAVQTQPCAVTQQPATDSASQLV